MAGKKEAWVNYNDRFSVYTEKASLITHRTKQFESKHDNAHV